MPYRGLFLYNYPQAYLGVGIEEGQWGRKTGEIALVALMASAHWLTYSRRWTLRNSGIFHTASIDLFLLFALENLVSEVTSDL